MLHRLSIRSILGGIIIAMGALIILLAGFNLQSAWQRNRAAQRVVALATIDGDVFNALTTMRIERAGGTWDAVLRGCGRRIDHFPDRRLQGAVGGELRQGHRAAG